MKNPWVIVGLLAVVLIGGSVWYSGAAAERNNEGVVLESHIKGNPDATVTLVEYSDLQCPACAAFQPYVDDVIAAYGDSIRFEYRHFPLPIHQYAEVAARAAEAAGVQGKFFEFVSVMFTNQTTWTKAINPAGNFMQYAEEIGLDVDQFKRHMNASLVRDKVKADAAAARDLGITGTPTFFLNDQRMTFETYDDFRAQIETAVNPQVEFELTQ
jgi:protein-disulfide isomerase